MTIEINNKKYKVKFGFGATRRIVEFYGYKKPSDYEKLVKKFKLDKIEDPSFEQLSFLGELFKAGVLNAGEPDDFSSDDLMDAVMQNPKVMEDLIGEFQKSQIQNDVVNPRDRGKK
jgi:hypothetical protein